MAFLGSIGKFIGRTVGSPIGRAITSVVAPVAQVGLGATSQALGIRNTPLEGALGQIGRAVTTQLFRPAIPSVQTQPFAVATAMPQAQRFGVPVAGGAIRTAAPIGPITSAAARLLPTGAGLKEAVQAILQKVAVNLGLKRIPTPSTVLRWAKLLGRFLAVAQVAATLGILEEELATLIFHQSRRRRRRMNVCNPKAMRRALRRIEGFDRLVTRTRGVLGKRRKTRCRACKATPCRC